MPRKEKIDEPDDIFSTGLLDSLKDATSDDIPPEPEAEIRAKLEVVPDTKAKEVGTKPAKPTSVSTKTVASNKKPEKPSVKKPVTKGSKSLSQNVTFKTKMTPEQKKLWSDFRGEFEEALGARLDDSNIIRPLVELLVCDYQEQILEAAIERRGDVSRPSNHDKVAMAEYDAEIAKIIEQGLKKKKRKAR